MKNRLMRVLALAMLLALAAGVVPATAATPKAKIVTEILYTDYEYGYQMRFENLPEDADIYSVISDNAKVIKVENKRSPWLTPLKSGKAGITVKYKSGGKRYRLTAAYTVKKTYPAVSKLYINGTKETGIRRGERQVFCRKFDPDTTKNVINLRPAAGWKITRVNGFFTDWDREDMVLGHFTLPTKSKVTVRVDQEQCAFVTYALKNTETGKTFRYTIEIARVGE